MTDENETRPSTEQANEDAFEADRKAKAREEQEQVSKEQATKRGPMKTATEATLCPTCVNCNYYGPEQASCNVLGTIIFYGDLLVCGTYQAIE